MFTYGRARRFVVLATVVLAAVVSGATAQAQPVATGSISLSGDPDDIITGGQTYAYSTSAGDNLVVDSDVNHLRVQVNATSGSWWMVDLAAPTGRPLAIGDYADATEYRSQPSTLPALLVTGNGRSCSTVTGAFAVQRAEFGPHGYVRAFDATYEQHCDGAVAALRGDLHITNPPPPPELALGLTVSTTGSAKKLTGDALINGTVTCTVAVPVSVYGSVTQVVHKVIVRGAYNFTVDCRPGAPVPWSVAAVPTGTTPFGKGKAEAVQSANAVDPAYGNMVSTSVTTVVDLVRG